MNLRRCFRCMRKMPDPFMNSDGTYSLECKNCKNNGITIGIYDKPLDELITLWNSLTPAEGFFLDSEDPKSVICLANSLTVESISCFILDGKKIEIDTNHDIAIKEILKEKYQITDNILNLNNYEDMMKSIDLCKVSFHAGICDISFNIKTCSKHSKLAMIDMFQTNVFYTKVKKITFLIFNENNFEIKSFDNVSDSILFLSDMRQ